MRAAIVFYVTGAGGRPVQSITMAHIPLGGYTLTARLTLDKTVWTWGDGTTTSRTAGDLVGQPYTDRIPCESATECSRYISHVYITPGKRVVSVTAYWRVKVSVDGTGQDIPITGDVYRGDPAGKTITVHQARAIIVPNR